MQRDETDRTSYKEHCRPVQEVQGKQAVCVRGLLRQLLRLQVLIAGPFRQGGGLGGGADD